MEPSFSERFGAVIVAPTFGPADERPSASTRIDGTPPVTVTVAVHTEPVGLVGPGGCTVTCNRFEPPVAGKVKGVATDGEGEPVQVKSTFDVEAAGAVPSIRTDALTLIGVGAVGVSTTAAGLVVGGRVEVVFEARRAHLYVLPLRTQINVLVVRPA